MGTTWNEVIGGEAFLPGCKVLEGDVVVRGQCLNLDYKHPAVLICIRVWACDSRNNKLIFSEAPK